MRPTVTKRAPAATIMRARRAAIIAGVILVGTLAGPIVPSGAAARTLPPLPELELPWLDGVTHPWTGGPHGSAGSGLDFGARAGNWTVYPAAAGTVLYRGLLEGRVDAAGMPSTGFGYGVIVDHGAYQTVYAHMDRASVFDAVDYAPVGAAVTPDNPGSTLGLTGCSGLTACAPHLHLDLRRGISVPKGNDPTRRGPNLGKGVSFDGVAIGGWLVRAVAVPYDGTATNGCGLTVSANKYGTTNFMAGQTVCPSASLAAATQAGLLVLAPVEAGRGLSISASGTWCMGGTGSTAECGGPDGIRAANPDEPDVVLPTAEIGTLIGRIGSGPWFAIGTGTSFTSSVSGTLTLVFNDRVCCYGDNSGSISIDVVIGP